MELKINTKKISYFPLMFFWIIALLPKAAQLILLGSVSVLEGLKLKKKKIDQYTIFQMLYLFIYLLSIIVNAILGIHERSRIQAAINTFLINCISLYVYIYLKNNDLNINKVCKLCTVNLFVLNILAIISKTSSSSLNHIKIFGHTLTGADWLNGIQTVRFYGFLDYSNLVIFAVFFFIPYAIEYLEKRRFWLTLTIISTFFTVYVTNSRSGLVLYLLLLFIYIFAGQSEKLWLYVKKHRSSLFVITFLAFLILLFFFRTKLIGFYYSLLNSRVGSNNMRLNLYKTSMRRMMQESPLIGLGIKDLNPNGYPFGSHSTYIGVFYKTGIIGGIIYILSVICLLIELVRRKVYSNTDLIKKTSIIFILILMFVEDIDGADWAIYLMAFFAGTLLRWNNQN